MTLSIIDFLIIIGIAFYFSIGTLCATLGYLANRQKTASEEKKVTLIPEIMVIVILIITWPCLFKGSKT